jgi:hypothetical protein
VVALASGVFAADPAVFVGFLQIGPVDIHKKRRLAGELSGFSPKKASNSPCFVDAGATTPLPSKLKVKGNLHAAALPVPSRKSDPLIRTPFLAQHVWH